MNLQPFPFQDEVIEWALERERCVKLWSAPGELVFSPFAGVGSEGVVALQFDRRFIGSELKASYWETACRNLESARSQLSLLAGEVA